MSDFLIEYDVLASVIEYSKDLERQTYDYAEELERNIVTAIDNVTGASSGNLANARDLVSDKIKMLKQKSAKFNHLANQITELIEVGIQMDQEVADTIAMQSRNKLVHNESGRLENWGDKILKLLVGIGDNKLVMKLIADRIKDLFPGSRFTKDFIIEWYKEALTEYRKSEWMSGYGKEVRKFPDLKNNPENDNVNLKNAIKNWYKDPDYKQSKKSEDKENKKLLPYEQDLVNLKYARNLPQAYRYLLKYLWDRFPGLYSEQMKQMAIIGGMDQEWAEIYGDFATMTLLEGFAVVTVKGVQAIKNLKTGELIYSESVVAGSGVGNLTNKASGGAKGIREGAGNAGKAIEGAGDAVKGGSKIADDIVKQGQKALNNFDINSSYVKPKHLSSSGGKGAKFLGDTKEAAEVILKDVMSSGKVQSIADNGLTKMGQQSYQIVIDAGKEVGTKGETLIKIVISEDGGMLSAYPVK